MAKLTESDWVVVKKIAKEIMEVIPATARHERLEHEIGEVLARNILLEMAHDEAREREETTHRWEFGSHSISSCRIDWCGRYRGQRRDHVSQ